MPTPHRLNLAELDREAVAQIAGDAVLVLPIGATEQHGPALPLGTDAALVDATVDRALANLSAVRPVVLAPTVPYGNSVHHLFACAGSLSSGTLLLVLADLIDSFVASGFRRIFIVNGHGGNDECVRLAVKDAANRHTAVFGAVSYWTLAPRGPIPAEHVPGHAGAFEASLLMAARPDLVPPGTRPAGVPGPRALHTMAVAPGVTLVRHGDWPASGGFTDSPADADAAVGATYLDAIASRLAEVLLTFSEVPLTPSRDGQECHAD